MMPNSMKVLREIGVEEKLRRVAFQPYSHLNREWDTGNDCASCPCRRILFGAPYLCMHRADLHDALAVPFRRKSFISTRNWWGSTSAAAASSSRFADGTRAQADAVIGADGVHSVVRDIIIGPDAADSRGPHRLSRGLFFQPAQWAATLALSRTKWWGPDRHIVIYYTTAARSELYFVTSVPEPAEWMTRESWSAKGDVRSYARPTKASITMFAPCSTPARIATSGPFWNASRCRAGATAAWSLLGDACHPMTPYMAQGAATAIEDAAMLARCLEQVEGEDIEGAFLRYEAHRKPRTSRIQAISSANTWMKGGDDDTSWLYGYDAWNVPLTSAEPSISAIS